ncbi:hypothetical protein DSUL_20220 [Desulfovibrionales bacterium]
MGIIRKMADRMAVVREGEIAECVPARIWITAPDGGILSDWHIEYFILALIDWRMSDLCVIEIASVSDKEYLRQKNIAGRKIISRDTDMAPILVNFMRF